MYVSEQFYIIAVSQFQDDDHPTSECDLESMTEENELLQELVFDENISHPEVEVCETSSPIFFYS